ncbi:MAG: GntR family transcriptional regulator [Acidobacteria bacterium]|nr:GntR family transcriptional regulator [Acidobacteriota bacterium]
MPTSKKRQTVPVRITVFEHLREEILRGNLLNGERLIESDLAKKLKVSRTPIREALRKLENEGLVRYSRGRGVTVGKLTPQDMLDFYAIRGALEGLAARLAAQRISEGEIAKLKEIFAGISKAFSKQDYRLAVHLHTRFNDLIFRAAGNPRLYELVSRFHEYTERSQLQSLAVSGRFQAIQEEHEAIIAAIEKRHPHRAERAVRKHLEQASRAYQQSSDPFNLLA